jgi:hypothetical protein
MGEKLSDLLKYLQPDRFPIVIIIGLILFAIIDNRSHPYQEQKDKIEILKTLKANSTDTILLKGIDKEYRDVLASLNKSKNIDLVSFIWYLIAALVIYVYLTLGGYLRERKTQNRKSWIKYAESSLTLVLPISIVSFLFNFYIIDNDFVTIGIAAIITYVIMRLTPKKTAPAPAPVQAPAPPNQQ